MFICRKSEGVHAYL